MEKKRFNINLDDSVFTKERTPIKAQFQVSSKEGQRVSSECPSSVEYQSVVRPLSYAEFIVQNKDNVGAPRKECSSEQATSRTCIQARTAKQSVNTDIQRLDLPTSLNGGVTTLEPSCEDGPSGTKQRGSTNMTETALKQKECQMTEPSLSLGPYVLGTKSVGSGSSIIVSPRQRGNPILKFVRSVPWEFGEIVPDYVLGQTTCALFLSLRYHNLNPNYIHDRLKQLGQTFTLRVLLVQVDVKDPHHSLKELAPMCIMADCTLILAWSPEEAGRYLETYKSYEKKPADLLKEQVEKDYLSKVTDCLTTVKSVNKTDAITLLSTFSSVEGIINASKEDLVLCPGLGPQKARRLYDVLHQPFLKSQKKDT